MKKNVIAILLSIVLAVGTIGAAPVMAAESTAEEMVPVQEENVEEQEEFEQAEEADSGLTVENAPEEEISDVVDEEPGQNTEMKDEDDVSPEKMNESANAAETAEIAEEEEEIKESSDEETTSTELAKIEEPLVIEEEIEIEEVKEAELEGDVVASGSCGEYATWTVTGTEDDLSLTISGSGETSDFSDTSIPWSAKRAKIKRIVVEDGITKIGSYAFYAMNKLTEVSISDSVTVIGDYCFSNCIALESICIPDGVVSMGSNIFENCNKLISAEIGNGVTGIGVRAFSNCSNLKSITIGNGVKSIGSFSFGNCKKIEKINLHSLETWLRIKESWLDYLKGQLYIDDILLTRAEIPDGITTIRTGAFDRCGSTLLSVSIPDSVTSIEESAFKGCSGLTEITIPDSVTSIGKSAFQSCSGLTSIEIPSSISSISESVFSDCKNLTEVIIPDSVTTIGDYAFKSCKNLKSVSIPESVWKIGNWAFYNCGITSITIPDGVMRIGEYAFAGNGLKFISLPDSITGLGEYPFGRVIDYEDVEPIGTDSSYDTVVRFRGTTDQWNRISGYRTPNKKCIIGTFSGEAYFELAKTQYYYTGNPVRPVVTAICFGKQLVENVDYTVQYNNCTEIGTATVNVSGIGEYSGTDCLEFKIRLGCPVKVTCKNLADGMKVSWEEVAGAEKYLVYRNNTLLSTTTALYVLDRAVKLNSGKKYTYKVVAVDSNGDQSEVYRTATYYRLLPTGIKTLTNPSAGKMTVAYNKSSGSSGYVVRYGLKSDMSDAKVVSVQGAGTLSRTFSGLKKGKTYYVQVRTYKIDNGVRYYSGYCRTKSIKIKK